MKNNNIKNNLKKQKFDLNKREEGKHQKKIDYNSPTLDSFIKNGGIITDNEYEITSDIENNISNYSEENAFEKGTI